MVTMSKQDRDNALRALESSGSEYDEDAFRYFLAIEQARAGRSQGALPVLFATLEPTPGKPVPIPRSSASRLFHGMRGALRDTDVMGWYEQDHVAGAVLSSRAELAEVERALVIEAIQQRVDENVKKHLPAKVAHSLRVRVVHLKPKEVASA